MTKFTDEPIEISVLLFSNI